MGKVTSLQYTSARYGIICIMYNNNSSWSPAPPPHLFHSHYYNNNNNNIKLLFELTEKNQYNIIIHNMTVIF